MSEIFGLPMDTLMIVLIVGVALCLLYVALIALRKPIVFKMAMRNIPRRKAQTVLIILGLMLSTMIIAAAFGTGDTLEYSLSNDVYSRLGHVDELIIFSQDENATNTTNNNTMPIEQLALVDEARASIPDIDGVMPILELRVPVMNVDKQLGEPDIVISGIDPTRVDQFGGIMTTDGNTFDMTTLVGNQVVVSERAAKQLDAEPGDTLNIFYENRPIGLSVVAIVKNSYLVGVRSGGNTGETPGLAMPLAELATLSGKTGVLNRIAISNTGTVRDSTKYTDSVVASLRSELAGSGLAVSPAKKDDVEGSKQIAQIFSSLFLVLGLFSVAAGLLLIVLIFTMLAAERRAEMGMARAIGQQRSQLVQQFVAEGAGYALISSFIGALLGILAAIGIGLGIKWLFGDFLPVTPHVTLRSLIVAYCLGVVITFLTVRIASGRISRLNVVAAIRDLPDDVRLTRRTRTLVFSIVMILLGGFMVYSGLDGDQALPFLTGLGIGIYGIAILLAYLRVSSRLVLTLASLTLIVIWLLPDNLSERIFGKLDGGFELFFVTGIFLVIASTLIVVQNTAFLLSIVGLFGSVFRSKLPAVRTAIAYPGAARQRTGLTIAMFSLIIFSLVTTASLNTNFSALFLGDGANAGWDVRADAINSNPLTDFKSTLENEGVDTSGFTGQGTTYNPSTFFSELRLSGTEDWKNWPLFGMDENFIDNTDLRFQARANGYESDEAILNALKTEPNVAVIDVNAVPNDGPGGNTEDFLLLTPLNAEMKTFEPVMIDLADPNTGEPRQVKIIGIIDGELSSLFGLFANQETIGAIYPTTTITSYYISLKDPAVATEVAEEIEKALLMNGVQATSIVDQLKESQRQSFGFFYIIQGFLGLGLFVGVAAVGVIAFRSVVERRQQIGVLRAIGFQQSMVSLSFMIETIFVVGIGVIAGTILGLFLSKNIVTADDLGGASFDFIIPWGPLSIFLFATVAVALLTTWIPARQAARIAPAEALRYE